MGTTEAGAVLVAGLISEDGPIASYGSDMIHTVNEWRMRVASFIVSVQKFLNSVVIRDETPRRNGLMMGVLACIRFLKR
jgi:hypothetical protein